MLHKILIPTFLSLLVCNSFAQSEASKPDTQKFVVGVPGISKVDAATQAKAKEIADEVRNAFNSAYGKEIKEKKEKDYVKQATRQFDAIADEALAKDREKILEFMGIPKTANSSLYYFVSFSMPMPLLRSYVLDAMWSGGTLVFRGSTPGKKLNEFVVEDLRSLVYGKGASAAISIDPRLFDILDVRSVPTIAFVEDKKILDCFDPISTPFKDDDMKETGTYDKCKAAADSFYKVSGAVSGKYALDLFEENGAKGLGPYKHALSEGYRTGQLSNVDKSQTSFKGKWEDVLTPEAKAAISDVMPVPKERVK